jgi:hypothetical protein
MSSPSPPPTAPQPAAILADYNSTEYLIAWSPDRAGVIPRPASIVRKTDLRARWPHIEHAWAAAQEARAASAQRIETKFRVLAGYILKSPKKQPDGAATNDEAQETEPDEVRCDEGLLSGMRHHWGVTLRCAIHPPDERVPLVCEACRVGQCLQPQRIEGLERGLVMQRGARVALCEVCAEGILWDGVTRRKTCVCDTAWSCGKCREHEVAGLAKVRAQARYREGTCGDCGELVGEDGGVDFCLFCTGVRGGFDGGSRDGVGRGISLPEKHGC